MGGVKSVRCFGDEVSDVKPISHMFTHLYTVWNSTTGDMIDRQEARTKKSLMLTPSIGLKNLISIWLSAISTLQGLQLF